MRPSPACKPEHWCKDGRDVCGLLLLVMQPALPFVMQLGIAANERRKVNCELVA